MKSYSLGALRSGYFYLVFSFLPLIFFPQEGFTALDSSPILGQLQSIPSELEKDIDYMKTLVLVSKDWNSKVKMNSALIDRMTANLQKKMTANPDPETAVSLLRKAIHGEEQFAFTERVNSQGFPLDSNEWFFHGLLQSKRGYCMNLSLLYLVVGERLGLPLYGVALPNHFFVRYDSPKYRVNIETTQGGRALPDDFYYRRYGVTQQTPFFMKDLGKKQTLGAYFSNVGMAYYTKKMQDKAMAYLNLATKINPRSIEARNNLGNILSEMKLFDQAIIHYEAAWETDPSSGATQLNLAIAYSETGLNAKAAEMFLQVVARDPGSVIAHQELAKIYLDQKKPVKALLHLKILASLNSHNLRYVLQIADLYLQLSNPSLALQILKDVQTTARDNFQVRERLAEIYYRLEEFDRAIVEFHYLIEQHPEFSRAYLQLGWTYYRAGNLKMAIVWTKQGLKRDKGNFIALGHMNLGLFFLLERNYKEARNWYRKALADKDPKAMKSMIEDLNDVARKIPDFSEVEFFSGWLHYKGGQGIKAVPHLEYYLATNPDGSQVSEAREILEKIKTDLLLHPIPGKAFRPEDTPKGMVEIPAGEFIVGSDDRGRDERPSHRVHLDAFYIDKYEVRSDEFAKFLNTMGDSRKYYRLNKYGTLQYNKKFIAKKRNLPINNVSWAGANAYCRWKKKRLPTEAEWEKAARGSKGQIYPWGDDTPSPHKARFNQFWEELKLDVLVSVDSMPEGKSPFGVFHMAGNVKEWVEDWYDREYYKNQDHKINPLSPPGGTFKVLKGGSWRDLMGFIYSSFRSNSIAESMLEDYGFRCAKSAGKDFK